MDDKPFEPIVNYNPETAAPDPSKARISESIAHEAHGLVHGERAKTYGHPRFDFTAIAKVWTGLLSDKLKPGEELDAYRVAVLMTGLKLCRLVKSPDHHDSRVDTIGYMLTMERLDEPVEELPKEPAPIPKSTPCNGNCNCKPDGPSIPKLVCGHLEDAHQYKTPHTCLEEQQAAEAYKEAIRARFAQGGPVGHSNTFQDDSVPSVITYGHPWYGKGFPFSGEEVQISKRDELHERRDEEKHQ